MKRIICFIVSAVMICSMAVSVFADNEMPDCKVSLTASHISANVGDQIKISLSFDNAADYPYGLAAFCANLSYNKNAVKLDSVSYDVPKADITSNNKAGLLKSLYIFASNTKKPGFNKNGVFYTATFTVLDCDDDFADFSVTFDTITVSNYSNDNKVTNYQVPFDSPSVSVDIIGNESELPPEEDSKAPVSSASTSSASTSSASTSSASTSSASTSSASTSSASISSAAPAISDAPTESKPQPVENDKFVDVEDDSPSGTITVDKFDNEGNIIESGESSVAQSPSSQVSSEPEDSDPTDDDILFIVVISVFAATVIGAAAVIIILLIKKKRD